MPELSEAVPGIGGERVPVVFLNPAAPVKVVTPASSSLKGSEAMNTPVSVGLMVTHCPAVSTSPLGNQAEAGSSY